LKGEGRGKAGRMESRKGKRKEEEGRKEGGGRMDGGTRTRNEEGGNKEGRPSRQ
jgi:hypothetical protein